VFANHRTRVKPRRPKAARRLGDYVPDFIMPIFWAFM
jgi:hypothetical protein